jgi:hypothetical protein
MSNSSSGFLSKSIFVLILFLVSMGVSLFIGKMLGRNIMSLTRSNIEEKYPDQNGEGVDQGTPGGSSELARSDFGFDESSFAPDEAPLWANPDSEQFTTVSDEPLVDLTVMSDDPDATDTAEGEEANPDETDGQSGEKPKESGDIFSLSDASIYRIQVGTFEVEDNASSVWRRLTQAGYDAHISSFTDADGQRFKVFVGSFGTREEADSIAEQLRAMNFNAWVYQER